MEALTSDLARLCQLANQLIVVDTTSELCGLSIFGNDDAVKIHKLDEDAVFDIFQGSRIAMARVDGKEGQTDQVRKFDLDSQQSLMAD